jgi:glycosyltransferase involved in cell wall biosynthesis
MNSKKTIFFTTPAISTFVQTDIDILSKHYNLRLFIFNPSKKWLTPWFLVKQFIALLTARKTSMYICKFPGYLSLLPVIFGKIRRLPVLLIAAGTESASIPAIGYGNFNKRLLGHATSFSFRGATHITPVHRSLMRQEYTYIATEHKEQGIYHFCKGLKTPFTEIFYGFDSGKWQPSTQKRLPASIATIASGFDQEVVFLRKGIDLIFAAARNVPEFTFTVIGAANPAMLKDVPSNVRLLPKMDQKSLSEILQTHEYYAQISMFEGFPNSLCEAMLCGCVPIGSNVSAIPEIIDKTGFVLRKKSVEDLVSMIRNLNTIDVSELSHSARKRVMDNYNLETREKKLHTLIGQLLKRS